MKYDSFTKEQLIEKIISLESHNNKSAYETPGENEELYQVLFNSSKDAIMTLAPPSWKFTSGNKAILEMFKVNSIEEYTKMVPWNVSPEFQPDGRRSDEKAKEMIQKAMKNGLHYFDWTHQRMDGENFPAKVLLSKVELSKKVLLQATVRDISDEQNTLNELQESVKKFKDLFENMNESFALHKIIVDENNNPVDYRFLEVNPLFAQRGGLKPEDYQNKRVLELFPKTEKYWIDFFGKVALTGQPAQYTNYTLELDKYFEVRAYSPKHQYFAAIFTDVTERIKTEQELRDEKEITETALNSQKDTFFLFEPDTGKAIRWNKSFSEMSGYSDKEIATMKAPKAYCDKKDTKRAVVFIQEILKSGHGVIDLDLICKDGSKVPMEYNVSVIKDESGKAKYFIAIGRDITEYKAAEKEKMILEKKLRRSQRLETIGTLAGGIAHDFNNVLAPIMGYTEMVLNRMDKTDSIHKDLSNVLKASFRAKDLVEQILLFSKQSEKERGTVDLQSLINEALKLLRPSIPATIEIHQNIDKSCSKIFADSSQIHQVIMNLCTNAWHAMEESGGALQIDLKQIALDTDTKKLNTDLQQGDYACLSIMDSGPGMPENVIEHIFEPFFTTKAVNKGTGLGLSVVHGIVLSHKGDIVVKSEPGKGTSFQVYLPIIKSEIVNEEKNKGKATIGSEHIMVIDDEPAIKEMLKMMLESFGYTVDVFNTGTEALKVFKSNLQKYDILISDLTMPQMNGLELAYQFNQLKENFPIVIITGFGDSLNLDTLRKFGIKQVLNKPIMAKDLAIAIREVLDKQGSR